MPRDNQDQLGWGKHDVVATGLNDGTKQVSVNAWNDSTDQSGLFGFVKQSGTISGNAIVPTGSVIEIQLDGTLNTLTTTNNNEFDLIYLIGKSGEDAITITHNASGGSGNIRLLGGASKTLSTTVPLILMARTIGANLEWLEYGGGATVDAGDLTGTTLASGVVTSSLTQVGTIATGVWNGTAVADGYLGTGINATKLADGTVTNAELQYINTLSSNAQTQLDAKQASLTFGIADTNKVQIDGSGSAAGEYAKFTANGIIGEEVADVKTDLSLNNVENTALSTWAGTTNVTTLGTITTGTWTGTAIADDNGGTGQTTYATGDILYASGSNTLAKLNVGSADDVLTLAGGVPTWATSGGGFGSQQFWCDGGAFIATPSSTAGTATSYGQTRVLSNGVSVSSVVLPEHATIDSRCTFTWTPPENWNAGTILAKIYWTMQDTTTTSVGDTGAFEVSAVAISNDDTLNASFGTAVAVTDVFLATNDLHVATISGAITVGGSPANADLVQIQINRNAGSDTLEAGSNVELLGIILEYTQDASTSSG